MATSSVKGGHFNEIGKIRRLSVPRIKHWLLIRGIFQSPNIEDTSGEINFFKKELNSNFVIIFMLNFDICFRDSKYS